MLDFPPGSIRPRIVILGGGFAGMAVAQRLEARLRPDEAEIVLISRENFTLFTPMLPEVISGELDVRHVVTPIRPQLRRTQFVLADVQQLDLAAKSVRYTHTLTGQSANMDYDQVVLAMGSSTSTFGLPGVAQRAFALKTLEDAGILRNRLVWLLELADATIDAEQQARLLTIVVVGGGFTGVEAAGELVGLFRSVVRFYPNVALGKIRLILLEGGATLLPGLPPNMGRYSERALAARGIEIITGDGVSAADDRGLVLQSGRRIETATIVWSAGVTPSPSVERTALPLNKRGAVLTDATMRVEGFAGVWAAGDCAAIPNGAGGTYPPTAQHAIREGPVLADNIVATLRGKPPASFHFTSLGMMASLGGRKAVAQLPGDRILTGFPAWFLWRSYYLLRLPGLDRKLRVAFDWLLELLFPRDIAELRIYSRKAQSSAAVDAGIAPRDEPTVNL
ncbi:MAG TPA: NAD(P)/FAD-dependent oxidoreductase [Candidatus Dormibacteraeota bacterium]|nr:NAD(P)/FAD-dependent oxidoreductase [Candidatus Dormibacteraeota bacterium]